MNIAIINEENVVVNRLVFAAMDSSAQAILESEYPNHKYIEITEATGDGQKWDGEKFYTDPVPLHRRMPNDGMAYTWNSETETWDPTGIPLGS